MKKIIVSFVLLFGVFILAGCGNQNIETGDEDVATVSTDNMSEEKFESTMEDLYKKWGKMTCTMTTTEEGVKMNGILYIDGKKMRSDVKGSVEGINIEMSTLIKDGYSYSWSSASNEGWKMAYGEEEMEEWMNDAATDTDAETPMSFNCKKGVSGVSFDLPSNIEFKEMAY